MTHTNHAATRTLLSLLAATVYAALLLSDACSGTARGDDCPDDTTTLVRAAVAEAGFDRADAAATWHVYRKRGARVGATAAQMALRYASALRVRLPASRRWVIEITPACTQPPSWPASLRWERWRTPCLLLVADAARFCAGALPDPCATATHFGARNLSSDLSRAGKALAEGRWVLARCSAPTRNIFFREVRR